MRPVAILHIGAPKTGSTTIEQFLGRNRDALRARGIVIPRSVGRASAVGLTVYAHSVWRKTSQRKSAGLAERRAFLDHRARLRTALAEEIAESEASGPVDRLVFSTETLWALLQSPSETRRLAALIQSVASKIRVIVYLRRQDRFALSLYATQARFGRLRPFRFPPWWADGQFDYAKRLGLWAAAFGPSAIRVRPFEPDQLADGDLLTDFAAEAELGALEGLVRASRANPAPTSAVVEFMRRLNVELPRFEGDQINPGRGPIGDLAELVEIATPKLSAAPDDARRFLSRFAAGNTAVARRYLGRSDGKLFFDDTFEAASEPGYLGELTADEAIAIAAQLWRLREQTLAPDARGHEADA